MAIQIFLTGTFFIQIKPIAINSFFSFLSSLGGKVSHTILLSRPGHIPSCYHCLTLCRRLSISVSTSQLFFYFSFPMGTICIFQNSRKHGHFRILGTKKSRFFSFRLLIVLVWQISTTHVWLSSIPIPLLLPEVYSSGFSQVPERQEGSCPGSAGAFHQSLPGYICIRMYYASSA